MAIDTRNKRSSAMNPQCPWRGQWPAPDGDIAAEDRAHALWSYSGITSAGAGQVSGPFCVCESEVFVPGAVASQGDCC